MERRVDRGTQTFRGDRPHSPRPRDARIGTKVTSNRKFFEKNVSASVSADVAREQPGAPPRLEPLDEPAQPGVLDVRQLGIVA